MFHKFSSSSFSCRSRNIWKSKDRNFCKSREPYLDVTKVCMNEHLQNSYWADIHEQNSPVLIKGLVNNWPAVSDIQMRWTTGVRFDQVDKECLVPVEIGRNYMDTKLSIAHVAFGEFSQYMLPSTKKLDTNSAVDAEMKVENQNRVFLAQYSLQEIPLLEKDVKPFPAILETGKGALYRTNIWMGGEGGIYGYI